MNVEQNIENNNKNIIDITTMHNENINRSDTDNVSSKKKKKINPESNFDKVELETNKQFLEIKSGCNSDLSKKKRKLTKLDTSELKQDMVNVKRNIDSINNNKMKNNNIIQNEFMVEDVNPETAILSQQKGGTSDGHEMADTTKRKKKDKLKRKMKLNNSDTNNGMPNKKKHKNESSQADKNKNKFNQNGKFKKEQDKKENPLGKLSDERLKAYGLNPKKYRSFLKYKKF